LPADARGEVEIAIEGRDATGGPTAWGRGTVEVPAARVVELEIALYGGLHVTPTGTPNGDGSRARPWDLASMLAGEHTIPSGRTVWVHGGTYEGSFSSHLSGQRDAPIVVRAFPGERATLDGTLDIEGAYTTFWGLEVTSSDPATDTSFRVVAGTSRGIRIVNCVVHDGGGPGLYLRGEAEELELYGTIVYNNGQVDNADHGVALFNLTTGKTLEDNVLFNNWAYGLHAYSSANNRLDDVHLRGNVAFNNGVISGSDRHDLFVGADLPVTGLEVIENATYRTDASEGSGAYFGFIFGMANPSVEVTDNYFVGSFRLAFFDRAEIRRNTFVSGTDLELDLLAAQGTSAYGWDENAYFFSSPTPFGLTIDGTRAEGDFATWRMATGFDSKSTFSASRPSGTKVFVRANRYEPGRAHVVVYNWDALSEVSVNLSALLRDGDAFELRNVQDLWGSPVVEAIYAGVPVAIPMRASAPPALVGRTAVKAVMTGPTFDTFLLVRKGSFAR
jgi:parallel beta-helix repeat protein